MRLQSVEWGRNVSKIHSQLKGITHFVLPDLPADISLNRSAFFEAEMTNNNNNKQKKILTIAACRHTPASLERHLRLQQEAERGINGFLIVGGDLSKQQQQQQATAGGISTTMSSVEAIALTKKWSMSSSSMTTLPTATTITVWCVANPNDRRNCISSVMDKWNAGADGVITQPLFSSTALETLSSFPSNMTKLGGVAFPKTPQNLLFWLELLKQPEMKDDELFQSYLQQLQLVEEMKNHHTTSSSVAYRCARCQVSLLRESTTVDGFHYMPLQNTDALIELLHHDTTQKSYYCREKQK